MTAKKLIETMKRWWADPYHEVTCVRHGTVQVARVGYDGGLVDRCPICHGPVDRDLREPPAEQRGRKRENLR